jgi:sugar phosphate isomerase/epimerase
MTTLVLNGVSMLSVPLADVIPAAADAGFDAVSVLARAHRSALARGGLTTAGIRALAADHGIAITDVEAAGDWLGAEPDDVPPRLRTIVYPADELVTIASELGAATLTAIHAGVPRPLDESAAAFARLCDRAAEVRVRVALEFAAWMGIGSLATAWDVVRTANRPNGGLLVDLWHHRRSSDDDQLLASVPPDRIFSVQVCDATAAPRAPLDEDVLYRMLPGVGDLDVVGFLRLLASMGVDAPIGIEVFDADLVASGANSAARGLYTALSDVVRRAGLD